MRNFGASSVLRWATLTSLVLMGVACDSTTYTVRFISSQVTKIFTLELDSGLKVEMVPSDYSPAPDLEETIDELAIPGIRHTEDTSICTNAAARSRQNRELTLLKINLERQEGTPAILNDYGKEVLTQTPICEAFAKNLAAIKELVTGEEVTVPEPEPPQPTGPIARITGIDLDLEPKKPTVKLATTAGMVTLKTNLSKKDLQEALARDSLYIPAVRTGKNIALSAEKVPGTRDWDRDEYTYEESCQYTYTEEVCDRYWDGERYRRECRTYTRYLPGYRSVTVTTTVTQQQYDFKLIKGNTPSASVRFNLTKTDKSRYSGTCYES